MIKKQVAQIKSNNYTLKKFLRKLKIVFWKLARTNDSASEIGLGAAIGTFISVFPTFGFGTPFYPLEAKFSNRIRLGMSTRLKRDSSSSTSTS